MKTTAVHPNDVVRKWFIVDAADKPAGRLAVRIAEVLRGKDLPNYTPHVDMGSFVVVINAEKIKLSGSKDEQKIYKDFSGYSSGLKERVASVIREKDPTRIITQAVKGMLPKNNLQRTRLTRLKVYAGEQHPHAAQKPEALAV
ncbi:MAG: 50S ribosomal protein L13 [Kiritimatiellae bacterium]|nr:50S ribosomal protein L13 [Kiritimatiellia bacterium]MCO5068611.1 50S ribosomal protein L13 [Kiritimatiellia bacterium]